MKYNFNMSRRQQYPKTMKLFHVSTLCHDGEMFLPRPMDKDSVMEGENWKAKRICVSDSIDGAVSAIVDSISNFTGLKLYVHEPENLESLVKKHKVYKPNVKQVPDCEVTGEHWLKAPAKMKCIGQIEILGIDLDSKLEYMWYGSKTSMDRFKWRWINEEA